MRTTLITMIAGITAGIATVALATGGACNKIEEIDCKTVDSSCSALSPNCTTTYNGTVKSTTKRKALTSGTPGYDAWVNDDRCTYVCKITSDCIGLSPEVEVEGGYNKKQAEGAQACN